MSDDENMPFPWHLGVFDAHCHPTDTLSSLSDIPSMKARMLTVMATRAQDQELVAEAAGKLAMNVNNGKIVQENDDQTGIVPAFGWHPWFSHHLFDESQYDGAESLSEKQKERHYQAVLTPSPDPTFIASLPEPRSCANYLAEARRNLVTNPAALIGEIGLDRGFRLPEAWQEAEQAQRDQGLTPGGREGRRLTPYRVSIDHQKVILTRQLHLAGELGRAVSVHGVQAHGVLHDTLAATWKGHERSNQSKRTMKRDRAAREREGNIDGEAVDDDCEDRQAGPTPYAPRICLHSYSGPAETIKQYLHPSVPADMFFSFSTAVNFQPPTSKIEDAIRAVPDHRLLVESDLHTAGERMDAMLEDIVRRICRLKGWTLEEGARRLRDNWKRFVLGSTEDVS